MGWRWGWCVGDPRPLTLDPRQKLKTPPARMNLLMNCMLCNSLAANADELKQCRILCYSYLVICYVCVGYVVCVGVCVGVGLVSLVFAILVSLVFAVCCGGGGAAAPAVVLQLDLHMAAQSSWSSRQQQQSLILLLQHPAYYSLKTV